MDGDHPCGFGTRYEHDELSHTFKIFTANAREPRGSIFDQGQFHRPNALVKEAS
jgi:hypothetical protein